MCPSEKAVHRIWIFDFDGTLSRLVPDRNAAELLPEARELLSVLTKLPGHAVAVLSSRMLDDLIPRIGVEGLYLGGGSGAEWALPDGRRRAAGTKMQRLETVRETVMPELDKLSHVQGVDIEDKKWSVAVHVRQVAPDRRTGVLAFLESLSRSTGIRLFRGPEVFEIQFLPEIDKLFGTVVLCEMLHHIPVPGSLVYAGDDENDALVMEWVIRKGGTAFYVGREPTIPGVQVLENPDTLVREVRRLAGLDVKG